MSTSFDIDNIPHFYFDNDRFSSDALEFIVDYYYFRSKEKDRIQELYDGMVQYEKVKHEITQKAKERLLKKLESKQSDGRVQSGKTPFGKQKGSQSTLQKTSNCDRVIRSRKRQKVDD